jgi:hypothetical protein
MFEQGAIDWDGLRARARSLVRRPDHDQIERLRGIPIYLATPVSQYLAAGEPELAIQFAAEWQARLLALGLSPIAPALLTLPPMLAAGDDLVGLQLQAMDHDWWMRRCLPWMQISMACAVVPVRGWDQSTGVWQEACWFAADRNISMRGRPLLMFGECAA